MFSTEEAPNILMEVDYGHSLFPDAYHKELSKDQDV